MSRRDSTRNLLELVGATRVPDEGMMFADAGEFAARWNALPTERREEWWGYIRSALDLEYAMTMRRLFVTTRPEPTAEQELDVLESRLVGFAHLRLDAIVLGLEYGAEAVSYAAIQNQLDDLAYWMRREL